MLQSKGYAAMSAKGSLQPYSFERRAVGENDVLVDIAYCGVCHSDIHQVKDEWGRSVFPMVPGHEIIGHVLEVGKKVERFNVGDVVGVGCMVDSCRTCNACEQDLEQHCENGFSATYNSTEQDKITPTYGGYSNKIVVDQDFVLNIPKGLDLASAAPLLCAGITTYSPLHRWKIGPGQKVGIVGLGGLGHMAVKFAHTMGAHTVVLTHSAHKKADALRLGADEVLLCSDPAVLEVNKNSFDFLLSTISAEYDINQYINLLKLNGTLVTVGVPEKPLPLHTSSLISNGRSFSGSLIGGIRETQEMLDYCGKHNITADIELINIADINQAYERMIKSDVRYRFVIDMKTLNS